MACAATTPPGGQPASCAWSCTSPNAGFAGSLRGDAPSVRPRAGRLEGPFVDWYLDFSPVAQLLAADDPRLLRHGAEEAGQRLSVALHHLLGIGARVTGEGSVIEQILQRLDAGLLGDATVVELDGLAERATRLAVDLKTLRQAVYELWASPLSEARPE